jgi:hypothetical protein
MAELLPQSGETSKQFHIVLRETVLQSGSHDLLLISDQELKSHIALEILYISRLIETAQAALMDNRRSTS